MTEAVTVGQKNSLAPIAAGRRSHRPWWSQRTGPGLRHPQRLPLRQVLQQLRREVPGRFFRSDFFLNNVLSDGVERGWDEAFSSLVDMDTSCHSRGSLAETCSRFLGRKRKDGATGCECFLKLPYLRIVGGCNPFRTMDLSAFSIAAQKFLPEGWKPSGLRGEKSGAGDCSRAPDLCLASPRGFLVYPSCKMRLKKGGPYEMVS